MTAFLVKFTSFGVHFLQKLLIGLNRLVGFLWIFISNQNFILSKMHPLLWLFLTANGQWASEKACSLFSLTCFIRIRFYHIRRLRGSKLTPVVVMQNAVLCCVWCLHGNSLFCCSFSGVAEPPACARQQRRTSRWGRIQHCWTEPQRDRRGVGGCSGFLTNSHRNSVFFCAHRRFERLRIIWARSFILKH